MIFVCKLLSKPSWLRELPILSVQALAYKWVGIFVSFFCHESKPRRPRLGGRLGCLKDCFALSRFLRLGGLGIVGYRDLLGADRPEKKPAYTVFGGENFENRVRR